MDLTRYHDLLDDVSDTIAAHLHDDAEWLEDHHSLVLDALIFQLVVKIGAMSLKKLMRRLCSDHAEACRQEGMHRNKSGESVEWTTKLGTLSIPSPYFRNPHNGETARPMKDIFGVCGQGRTPALERALAEFGSECSYRDAEDRFEEHYGFEIGRSHIRRTTNDIGQAAEVYLETRLNRSTDISSEPEEMMVQLDGCAIRTVTFPTAMQAGLASCEDYEPSETVRVDEWREVRVGLVRNRGEVTPQYVSRMADYDELSQRLRCLAESKGLTDQTQVISPGDGGPGLKEALEDVFARFQFILDVPHLKEHLHDTAEALGLDDDLRADWVDRQLEAIWSEPIEETLDRLRSLYEDESTPDRLERLIGYLERFSDCLDYAHYRQQGWPIGSGEVESAHKQLPQARLKLPGAAWKVENINPMLALRVLKANGWWGDFWNWYLARQQGEAA